MRSGMYLSESFDCDICAKKRSVGSHAACAKKRQAAFATTNAKRKKKK